MREVARWKIVTPAPVVSGDFFFEQSFSVLGCDEWRGKEI